MIAALLLTTTLTGAPGPLDAPVVAPVVAPAPTLSRVRVALDRTEQSAWLLGAEEAGAIALLKDDGAVAWLPAEPAPKWLERTERPLAELPPIHLVAGLDDPKETVRDVCEELLAKQGPLAAEALGTALVAEPPRVRRAALAVLAEQPQKQWRARVKERLRDVDVEVRRAALRAYAVLKQEDLIATCLDRLRNDDSALMHHDAIGVLGRQGDLHVVDVVLEHLEGCDDRSERLVAFDALRRLTGMKFGRDAAAWRNWWTNHRDELLAPESG